MKTVEMFYEKIKSDEVLQEKLKSLQGVSEGEGMKQLVHIANEEGFEFSTDDLRSYIQAFITKAQEDGELDDDILDQVSGGDIHTWVIVSVFSFGIGCGLSAIGRKVKMGCELDTNGQ